VNPKHRKALAEAAAARAETASNPATPTAKTMTRSEFARRSPTDRMDFCKAGGRLTE